MLALCSDRDGNEEIYVMGWDGSGVMRLTNNPKNDFGPAWSPDGKLIVFNSQRDGNWEVYVMGADGSQPINLTKHPARDGDWDSGWSPDGTRITFDSNRDGNREIYVTLALAASAGVNADGSGVTRLTNHPAEDSAPAWSPDGMHIAFHSNRDGNYEIYTTLAPAASAGVNVDGSGLTRLTNHPADDMDPAWSPDSSRIAFCSNRDGNSEIYTVNVDGSGLARLTDHPANDESPAWSPDGKWITFDTNRDGNHQIYFIKPDGSGLSRLTNDRASDSCSAWQPRIRQDHARRLHERERRRRPDRPK